MSPNKRHPFINMIKVFTDAKQLRGNNFSIGFISACGKYSAFKTIQSEGSTQAENEAMKYAIECMGRMIDVTEFFTDSEASQKAFNGYVFRERFSPAKVNFINREANIANTWLRASVN